MTQHTNKDKKLMGQTPLQSKDDEVVLVLHRGRLAKLLVQFPRVETFTVARGWNQQVISAFQEAIHTVIQANPILSGRLYQDKGGILYVRYPKKPTTCNIKDDEFVTVQDLSDDDKTLANIRNVSEQELSKFLEAYIIPRFQTETPESTKVEISKGTHLFEASLLILPDNHVCYRIGLSHALGDAATYYLLVKQISCALQGKLENAPKIQWGTNPKLATHELAPASYSKRNLWVAHGWPVVFGVIISAITTASRRRNTVILLSREKINKKKQELLNREKNSFLSSHDIILAALCQSKPSIHLMSLNKDERERDSTIHPHDGGNFITLHHFPRSYGEDPNNIRQMVNSTTTYYGDHKNIPVPLRSMLSGKFCVTSSWANQTNLIEGEGIVNLGHFPSPRFYSATVLPHNVAVIFSMNENCIGVAHNFVEEKRRKNKNSIKQTLLDEILYDKDAVSEGNQR